MSRIASCLLCGRSFRHVAAHWKRKDHQDRGQAWWSYNVSGRVMGNLMLQHYAGTAMEHFTHLTQFNDKLDELPVRTGKTVEWFRYKT